MTVRWDILGIGAVAVDDLLYVAEFPRPDSKQPILNKRREGGGLTATALARGESVSMAVRVASAAAVLKATQPGGRTGIPNRPAVDQFLKMGK